MRGTGYKVCSDDDIRCVLNIQAAYLVLEPDNVSSLFIYIEGLVKKGKKLAVNNGSVIVEPISLLIHIDHTWRELLVSTTLVYPIRHFSLLDRFVKSQKTDGTVKSSRCKARKS
jgi:hypothetical protein